MSANDLSLAEAKTSVFITSPNVRSPARPKNRRAARSHSRRVPDLVLESIVPVTILVIWDLVTRLQWVDPVFMPTPLSVARAFYDLLFKDRLLLDLKVSGITVLEGFTIGAGLGLATGIAAGLSSTVDKLIGSILNSIRQVPPLAFLPLIILWAGAGVFMNTLQGIRSVAREYVEVGRIFEYPRLRMLRKVILPAALPSIFVGIRYGAGMAWFMIIAAEMLGGRHGLGYLLTRAQELLLTDQLLLVIVIIGLIGFSVDVGLRRLERRLLRWKRGFEG